MLRNTGGEAKALSRKQLLREKLSRAFHCLRELVRQKSKLRNSSNQVYKTRFGRKQKSRQIGLIVRATFFTEAFTSFQMAIRENTSLKEMLK